MISSLLKEHYTSHMQNDYIMTHIRQKVLRRKLMSLNMKNIMYQKVKNALKVYECQQKLAALDKEEEEIKYRQKQKRHERNERRRARRAEEATKKEEERRNEQIAIQKEAYLQAMMEFEEEKKTRI